MSAKVYDGKGLVTMLRTSSPKYKKTLKTRRFQSMGKGGELGNIGQRHDNACKERNILALLMSYFNTRNTHKATPTDNHTQAVISLWG